MTNARRISLLTAACVVVTAAVVGAITLHGCYELVEEQRALGVRELVRGDARVLKHSLNELWRDTRLLAELADVRDWAASRRPIGINKSNRISQYFTEMLRSHPYYDQIRLIGVDDFGRELVRVDRSASGPRATPASQLQRKGDRDYFKASLRTPPNQVYLSSINLNREHGGIQSPHLSTLRAAVRLDDRQGVPRGIVIINLNFNQFLADLGITQRKGVSLYLANESGDLLVHPDTAKEFGFELGQRHTLQEDFPAVASLVEGVASSVDSVSRGEGTHHFCRISVPSSSPQLTLVLGAGADVGLVASKAVGIARRASLATACLIPLLLMSSLGLARLQTEPLKRIAMAAESLSVGQVLPDLPTERSDEIGALARSFQNMTVVIEDQRSRLQTINHRLAKTNEELEHFVHIAAHDLREPLRKQRRFIDLLRMDHPTLGDSDADELLGRIATCSLDMQAMVDDFRDLTRIEPTTIMRAPIDLQAIIQGRLDAYSDQLRDRNVAALIDPMPEGIEAYKGLVEALYDNLIRNALAHAKHDGFELRFTAERSEDTWQLGVYNTGSSIPAEKMQEVFKMFRTAGTDSSGSGVGLSICQKVIDRHHGDLRVVSDENSVHFLFTLSERHETAKAT